MLLCQDLGWECNGWTGVALGNKDTRRSSEKRWAHPEIRNQIVYLEMIKRVVYNVLGQEHF